MRTKRQRVYFHIFGLYFLLFPCCLCHCQQPIMLRNTPFGHEVNVEIKNNSPSIHFLFVGMPCDSRREGTLPSGPMAWACLLPCLPSLWPWTAWPSHVLRGGTPAPLMFCSNEMKTPGPALTHSKCPVSVSSPEFHLGKRERESPGRREDCHLL